MTVIHLIRHGQAEAGWDAQRDPGLNAVGRQQAQQAAQALSQGVPLPIVVSPLRRARETAVAFEALWGRAARVETRIAEIPSQGMTLVERGKWLQTLPQMRWQALGDPLLRWRQEAIECLLAIAEDTVVVSHSLIINAVVSWVQGDDRVVCCQPLPGSCTTLRRAGAAFQLVGMGLEGASRVL
jgi:broad specificity phosphatase PhoE